MQANPMRRTYSLESATPGTIRTITTNTTSPSPNSGRSQSSENLKLLTKKESEFFSCSASPPPAKNPRTISHSYQIPPTIEKHIHATPHLLGGYLYKRRDYLRKQWRRRYFVLDRRSGVLTYYLIESAKELTGSGHEAIVRSTPPRGQLYLPGCHVHPDHLLSNLTRSFYAFTVFSKEGSDGTPSTGGEIQTVYEEHESKAFGISGNSDRFELAASSDVEREMWMAAIGDLKDIAAPTRILPDAVQETIINPSPPKEVLRSTEVQPNDGSPYDRVDYYDHVNIKDPAFVPSQLSRSQNKKRNHLFPAVLASENEVITAKVMKLYRDDLSTPASAAEAGWELMSQDAGCTNYQRETPYRGEGYGDGEGRVIRSDMVVDVHYRQFMGLFWDCARMYQFKPDILESYTGNNYNAWSFTNYNSTKPVWPVQSRDVSVAGQFRIFHNSDKNGNLGEENTPENKNIVLLTTSFTTPSDWDKVNCPHVTNCVRADLWGGMLVQPLFHRNNGNACKVTRIMLVNVNGQCPVALCRYSERLSAWAVLNMAKSMKVHEAHPVPLNTSAYDDPKLTYGLGESLDEEEEEEIAMDIFEGYCQNHERGIVEKGDDITREAFWRRFPGRSDEWVMEHVRCTPGRRRTDKNFMKDDVAPLLAVNKENDDTISEHDGSTATKSYLRRYLFLLLVPNVVWISWKLFLLCLSFYQRYSSFSINPDLNFSMNSTFFLKNDDFFSYDKDILVQPGGFLIVFWLSLSMIVFLKTRCCTFPATTQSSSPQITSLSSYFLMVLLLLPPAIWYLVDICTLTEGQEWIFISIAAIGLRFHVTQLLGPPIVFSSEDDTDVVDEGILPRSYKVTCRVDVDVKSMLQFIKRCRGERNQISSSSDVSCIGGQSAKVSAIHVVTRAVSKALVEFPQLNGRKVFMPFFGVYGFYSNRSVDVSVVKSAENDATNDYHVLKLSHVDTMTVGEVADSVQAEFEKSCCAQSSMSTVLQFLCSPMEWCANTLDAPVIGSTINGTRYGSCIVMTEPSSRMSSMQVSSDNLDNAVPVMVTVGGMVMRREVAPSNGTASSKGRRVITLCISIDSSSCDVKLCQQFTDRVRNLVQNPSELQA